MTDGSFFSPSMLTDPLYKEYEAAALTVFRKNDIFSLIEEDLEDLLIKLDMILMESGGDETSISNHKQQALGILQRIIANIAESFTNSGYNDGTREYMMAIQFFMMYPSQLLGKIPNGHKEIRVGSALWLNMLSAFITQLKSFVKKILPENSFALYGIVSSIDLIQDEIQQKRQEINRLEAIRLKQRKSIANTPKANKPKGTGHGYAGAKRMTIPEIVKSIGAKIEEKSKRRLTPRQAQDPVLAEVVYDKRPIEVYVPRYMSININNNDTFIIDIKSDEGLVVLLDALNPHKDDKIKRILSGEFIRAIKTVTDPKSKSEDVKALSKDTTRFTIIQNRPGSKFTLLYTLEVVLANGQKSKKYYMVECDHGTDDGVARLTIENIVEEDSSALQELVKKRIASKTQEATQVNTSKNQISELLKGSTINALKDPNLPEGSPAFEDLFTLVNLFQKYGLSVQDRELFGLFLREEVPPINRKNFAKYLESRINICESGKDIVDMLNIIVVNGTNGDVLIKAIPELCREIVNYLAMANTSHGDFEATPQAIKNYIDLQSGCLEKTARKVHVGSENRMLMILRENEDKSRSFVAVVSGHGH